MYRKSLLILVRLVCIVGIPCHCGQIPVYRLKPVPLSDKPDPEARFALRIWESAIVDSDVSFTVTFVDVLEDSRLYLNPHTWEGQATVGIIIQAEEEYLGNCNLTLKMGNSRLRMVEFGGHLIVLAGLEPHPGTIQGFGRSDYRASFVVRKPSSP